MTSLKDRLTVAAVLYRMCALALTILAIGYMLITNRVEWNWQIIAMNWNAACICLWLDQLCIQGAKHYERKEHEDSEKTSNN
jgi:nucleoside-specific outer membrane channel protein Tsx